MSKQNTDTFIRALGTINASNEDLSYSPFYSDMGLGLDAEGGISTIYLHYNRKTTGFLPGFIRFSSSPQRLDIKPHIAEQQFEGGQFSTAFYDLNTWLVESDVPEDISIQFTQLKDDAARLVKIDRNYKHLGENKEREDIFVPRIHHAEDCYLFEGYLENTDKRDPDSHFPVILGMRILQGKVADGDGIKTPLRITSVDGEKIVCAFSIRALDVEQDVIIQRLNAAPSTCLEASLMCYNWLDTALGAIEIPTEASNERDTYAQAIYTLLSNSSHAPGQLRGRISSFPSRGCFPTHYCWDSYFQNLGLARLEPRLEKDALLLLTENQRADGKIAHFLCSTWFRPDEIQAPLLGWAAQRLVKNRNDLEFAAEILPAMRKNTTWWLQQRMSSTGLVRIIHAYEVWDNTPRFDNGPGIAVDNNVYLIMQIRACAEFATLLGDAEGAQKDTELADNLTGLLIEHCYDKDQNLFWDIDLASNEWITIKTPACFMPFLLDLPLEKTLIESSLKEYLLNPRYFYGENIFPVLAYDEPEYVPDNYWRGPMWLPISQLMLEVLDKNGFQKEAQESRKKLLTTLSNDGVLHEYFNTQTGKGLGAQEQGWTAAIYIKIFQDLTA